MGWLAYATLWHWPVVTRRRSGCKNKWGPLHGEADGDLEVPER